MSDSDHAKLKTGLIYALIAYVWWGIVPPFFFTAFGENFPILEIFVHRILWSVLLLAAWLWYSGKIGELQRCLSSWSIVRVLLVTTVLIAANWLVYIHCVVSGQIIQGSLGYFINPLVNVLLGLLFFRERLGRLKWTAVALAAAGVLLMTVAAGQPPWLALSLALLFGMYGMLRKLTPADGVVCLSVEVLLLLPICIGYLLYLVFKGESHFAVGNLRIDALLLFGGVITVLPLACFGQAARRLPLTTLGFVQYLAPTVQFFTAIIWFDELRNLTPLKMLGFVLIWIGLAIFSVGSVLPKAHRRRSVGREMREDLETKIM